MARTARMKLTGEGTAYYHLMSRTNDRRFLFEKGRVKTEMVAALRRAAAFSGIELKAYVAMDNHFHVVCKVTRGGGPVPGEEWIISSFSLCCFLPNVYCIILARRKPMAQNVSDELPLR